MLDKVGAEAHELGRLSPPAARGFLAEATGAAPEALPPEADEVAKECGYLPLALATVAALVARGRFDWPGVLKRLQARDLRRLRAQLPDYEHEGVVAALEFSVEALEADDREAFLDCAVFPEDTDIPEAVLVRLWSTRFADPEDARDCAHRLADASLLSREGGYRLHDLYHDWLQQADSLPERHRRLLDAYRRDCPDGWHAGQDDGYCFDHLDRHLHAAGEHDELRRLLLSWDWLRARLAAGGDRGPDINGLLADRDLLAGDPEPTRLAAALRLSARVLAHMPEQLPAQLLGRLAPDDGPAIASRLDAARKAREPRVLIPRQDGFLTPPGALVRALEGHGRRVSAVAVLPDGRVVSGSEDSTLRVWDLATGDSRVFGEHEGGVTALAVLPDGRVVAGSNDKTLRVWDLATGDSRVLEGHGVWVTALAVLADGRVVSGSDDGALHVWDLRSGDSRALEGHFHLVAALAVLPDGRVVSGSHDETLRVWDLASGGSRILGSEEEEVTALAVPPDGRVISGSYGETLSVYDLASGGSRMLAWHEEAVTALAVPSDRCVVSGLSDRTLRVWDLGSGAEDSRFVGDDRITALAAAPDGAFVAGDAGGRVLFFDPPPPA